MGGESGGASFALTVNINGSGGESIRSQVEEAAEEFFDRCDAWWESKKRMSFG